MRVIRVVDWERLGPRIAGLEQGIRYPLGEDSFEIDHGRDYAAFFRRLGDLVYVAVLDGDEPAAVGAGVLRSVPGPRGPTRAWYLADVKVHPAYRGQRLPWRMLTWAFPRHYWRCPRGYAITMDPAEGPNAVERLASRFWIVPNVAAARLHLWSLDAAAARAALPDLERTRGRVTWRSLRGVKDIVLTSTGAPMPLHHAQFGPCAEHGADAPEDGAIHMFCAPEGDPLERRMRAAGHVPSATATVLAHRMAGWDWSFVLTSDI